MSNETAPEVQEAKKGNELLNLGCDVYAEVAEYATNHKTYASIRRWFQADDGNWYRTKNGLHVTLDDMTEVLAHLDQLVRFLHKRAAQISGDASGVDASGAPR